MKERFVELTSEQRQELFAAKKLGKRHTFRTRCTMILRSDDGYSITSIAELEDTTRQTVARWFNRYEQYGIDGLRTAKGRGRPPIVRFDNKKAINKIEQLVERYPQKLDQALEKIKEFTGKPMSKKTLQRILKKTAGLGNASADSQPSGHRPKK